MPTPPASSSFIFSRREEALTLFLSFGFLLVCVVDIGWNLTSGPMVYWYFLANIVFLNSIHVAFTYMVLASLPEFKAWAATKNKESFLYKKSALFFLFLFTCNWYLRNPEGKGLDTIVIKVLWVILPYYHTLWQHYGLSVMYNQKALAQANSKLKAEILQTQKKEKQIFYGFTLLSLLGITGLVLAGMGILNSAEKQLVIGLLTGIFLILLVYLISSSVRKSLPALRTKTLFQMRLFLYPISFFSPLGLIGLASVHGLEYASILRKTTNNSTGSWRSYLNVASLLFLVGLGFLCLINNRSGVLGLFTLDQSADSRILRIFYSALGAFSFLHYYLDGVMFKFKDDFTREQIGPLLVKS